MVNVLSPRHQEVRVLAVLRHSLVGNVDDLPAHLPDLGGQSSRHVREAVLQGRGKQTPGVGLTPGAQGSAPVHRTLALLGQDGVPGGPPALLPDVHGW